MIKLPQFQPRLAVCGHIKNGINVPNTDRDGNPVVDERGRPKYHAQQLDHYLVTTLQRDLQTGNFVVDQRVMDSLKHLADKDGKLRRVPIFVHSDDFEQFFPTQFAARRGKVICCRGDGEKAKRWEVNRGQRVGKSIEVECTCPWLIPEHERDQAQKGDPVCKVNADLRCKIALPDAITIGSVYNFHTTSVIGVPNMLGGFAEIQNLIGTLVWVPLWLELRAEKVQPEGFVKTVYSSFVHLRGSDVKEIQERAIAMVEAAQRVQKLAGRKSLMPLPPSMIEDEEEEEDVIDEYYGGTVETTATESSPAATVKDEPRGQRQRQGVEHVSQDNKMKGELEHDPEPKPEPSPPAADRTPSHKQPASAEQMSNLSTAMNECVFHTHGVMGDTSDQRKLKDRLWAKLVKGHAGYKWTELSSMQADELLEEVRGLVAAAKAKKKETPKAQEDLWVPSAPSEDVP